MERPKNIFQKVRDKEILDYMTYLEDQVRLINQNNDAKVYVSISRKMDDITKQINELDLDIDIDENGNNRNYKNFKKYDDLTDIAESSTKKLDYFKKRTTPEEIEKEEKYFDTPVERYVFGKLKNGGKED